MAGPTEQELAARQIAAAEQELAELEQFYEAESDDDVRNYLASEIIKARAKVAKLKESQAPGKRQVPDYFTPNTTAPKILVTQPDGTQEWIDNPNYSPPRGTATNPYSSDFNYGRTRYRYNAEGIPEPVFSFPEEEDRLNTYQQANLDRGDAKTLYDQEQDRIKQQQWEAQQELARKQAAWRTTDDIVSQQRQMAPYALRPGQTHFPGYEPGGAWSTLYPKLGLPFTPDTGKAAPVTLDWEDAWRRAMGIYGGQ